MPRLFIAIELPREVRATLHAAQERLARHALAVRWVDPAGAHLTLKFLGATPAARVARIVAALVESTRRRSPFMLSTTRLGLFPGPKTPRVVWLGVGGAETGLEALRADIEHAIAPLGYPTERRPFNPHLTLGRTLKDASRAELTRIGAAVAATAGPPPVTWHVSTISLMRSDPGAASARYTRVAAVDLDTESAAAIILTTDESDGPRNP